MPLKPSLRTDSKICRVPELTPRYVESQGRLPDMPSPRADYKICQVPEPTPRYAESQLTTSREAGFGESACDSYTPHDLIKWDGAREWQQ